MKVVNDYELPSKVEDEIKIKVHSTSVNPVDYKMRQSDQFDTKLPRVLGGDVAGVVVDEGGKKWKAGDRVFALTDRFAGPKEDGSYAEYAWVKEEWLAPAPKSLSLETEAGAVPLVFLTAYQALESGKPKKGARVLIHAASGGVGIALVQLAKILYGAHVVGTTGPKNIDFVKSIGADEVVNYREQDFAELYKDPSKHFDLIVDLIGGETETKSYSLIKPGGTFAHIINTGTDHSRIEEAKKWTDKSYTVTFVKPNAKQLTEVSELIDAGKLKVVVHKVWPLEEAGPAHDEVENGHSRGKNVLQVVNA